MKKIAIALILCLLLTHFLPQNLIAQSFDPNISKSGPVPAAWRTQVYLPLLKGKRVGIFAAMAPLW